MVLDEEGREQNENGRPRPFKQEVRRMWPVQLPLGRVLKGHRELLE